MTSIAPKAFEGSLLPSPTPFPTGVLPARVEEALSVAASAFTVPLAVPAVTFLAVIGAAIGRTRGLEVKPGWLAHPNLFWALVARSGMGKSPCSNAILKPIHERENAAFHEHQQALGTYDIAMREWQSAFARAQRLKEVLPDKPEPPHWSQVYIEDSTTQAVGNILSNNPRGVLWYRDELSGLLADLGRYDSKGGEAGDKARLLSAYDCGPWKVSRSTKDGLHIPHACVSIFGTVQPGLLPSLFRQKDTLSGFLPRFLFIRCEQEAPPLWTTDSFCGEPEAYIHSFITQALQLSFGPEEQPQRVTLSPEAAIDAIAWHDNQVLTHWYQPHLEQYEALAPKLRGAFFKLCLILHVLDCWSVEASELADVQVATVQRTATLMEWLQTQQRQVWTLLSAGNGFQEASAIERRVAQAVLTLSADLRTSILPTAQVVDHLNENLPAAFHVTADAVGKTYKKLGIETGRSSKERGAKLSPEILSQLATYFPPEKDVKGVIAVTEHCNSLKNKAETPVSSSVTPVRQVSLGVTPENTLYFSKVQEG